MNAERNKVMVKFISLLLALSVTALVGCATSDRGEFKGQSTSAGVGLTKKNYKVIKVGAKGESSGFKLLGLIPLANPSYSDAKDMLYKSIGEPLEGRAVALVNQTEDDSSVYLILFSIPTIKISADVIEYIDEPAAQ
jgi:hypothetical protein